MKYYVTLLQDCFAVNKFLTDYTMQLWDCFAVNEFLSDYFGLLHCNTITAYCIVLAANIFCLTTTLCYSRDFFVMQRLLYYW